MTKKLVIDGRTLWRKDYPRHVVGRILIGYAWNLAQTLLRTPCLRLPRRLAGSAARNLEWRRIDELRGCDVRVPEVVDSGDCFLLLSDLGPTLSHCLKRVANAAERDAMVARAAHAVAEVHARRVYLGQAVARNITLAAAGVGFIDFEEDPHEVMQLHEAQARDWLLFSYSVARHYDADLSTFAALLRPVLATVDADVVRSLQTTVRHLAFLGWTRRLPTCGLRAPGRVLELVRQL